MNLLQFIRNEVSNVMAGIAQQREICNSLLERVKSYIPKVQAAWIGGDADAFAADVMRKVVPAFLELIAALAGMNVNLTKATSIVDAADAKVKSLASNLGQTFANIF